MSPDMHSTYKKMKPVDRLLYGCNMAVIHALRSFPGLLGRKNAIALGRLTGKVLFSVAIRMRKKMLLNLNLAFGTALTASQKNHIARKALENLCASWGEVFSSGGHHLENSLQMISINGKEHLERALARGKGVIAASAHMGTYQLIGPRLSEDGYSSLTVIRDLENPAGSATYARCRELIRLDALPTVPEKIFFKKALGILRSGGILCIIADENKRRGGVFVDFFGRTASTAPGPAVLARRTGAAIVPMLIIRNPDDTQTIHIHEPIICERSDDEQRDIHTATAAFTRAIEQQIRRDPAQWPWNTWRWRTQPHGSDNAAKISKTHVLKRLKKKLKRFKD